MPKLCGRILLTILSLLPIQCIFAATIVYVNVNNPTPGDGSTWAKAYNDLNVAIAATPSYGEIWVAQGTYKPTTTSDRTIAFEMSRYMNIYGGFNGTEVARSDRNIQVNVTILSGDIGVPGDASDNSYNVMRITPANVAGINIDGFTIRDGNANKGYPGSTTLQPYNQGAGISVIYYNPTFIAGAEAEAEIYNCTFTNNFAVYGAGVSNYTDGTGGGVNAYNRITVRNSIFNNNTAVMGGGAIGNLVVNHAFSSSDMQNCVFINNHSGPGTASAIFFLADNSDPAYGTAGGTALNCVFYNNDFPLLDNKMLNGGTSALNCLYSIIWQTSGPYADNSFDGGGGISYGANDIRINTAPSNNINADPQFVNAPAGDFHVSPCSPVIDYSYNNYFSYPFDFALNPRPVGDADIGIYETTRTVPAKPTASAASYCKGAIVITDLSGNISNVTTGATLQWYNDASLSTTNLLPGAPTPATTTVGSTDYYVTQTVAAGCPSNAVKLTVTINDAPTTPIVTTPLGYCQSTTALQLNATSTSGNTLRWYGDNTTTVYTTIAPTPSTATATTTIPLAYFVSQRGSNGCESQRAEIDVNISAKPSAPTTTPIAYCQGVTAVALDAPADPGATLNWYSNATITTALAGAPTPTTSSATLAGSPQAYYVSQTSGGCEGSRAELDVTVNATPSAPIVTTPLGYCQSTTALQLSAMANTGNTLKWYGDNTTTAYTNIAPTPSTTTTTASIPLAYFVSQRGINGCESQRAEIDVNISAKPSAPITTPIAYCQGVTAVALDAPADPGATLNWYSNATITTALAGAPTPTTSSATLAGSPQAYYVSQSAGGCEGTRVELDVTVNAAPAAPTTPNTSLSYCQGATPDALDVTGNDLLWYSDATTTTSSATATTISTASAGTTSYYVSQTVSGCESNRLAIDVTIESALTAPVTDPVSYCQNDPTDALVPSGSGLLWYTAATGGTGSNTAPTPATTTEGSTTYYVSQTATGACESARSPLTVTVNANPTVTIVAVDKGFCKGTIVPLQASGADTYVWSPAAYLSDAGSPSVTATVQQDIQYTVTGTDDNGCFSTAQVDLHLNNNCGAYVIPTAFSPNNDGLNDLFRVNTPNVPKHFMMEILNRYGGKIFVTNDINIGWDGTQNGQQLDVGAYVYVVAITTSEGEVINKTGTVMLVR